MAEQEQRAMSIVPYSTASDVVLRHNDAIVVYDHASRQLVLQSADHKSDNFDIELTECPYCHRPIHDGGGSGGGPGGGSNSGDTDREARRGSNPNVQSGFVNPDYFRMLDTSMPTSPNKSSPPSPLRRLVQPVQHEGTPSSSSDYNASASPPHGISSAAFSPNYFKRFFVEEGELGRGGKGVVLLVKHVLDGVPLGYYACKRVPVGDDHEWLKKVLIEVQLLQHLSHQNLVSYRHVWLEDSKLSNFGPSVPCAFILQQYCNAGDLHKYICGSIQTTSTPQQLKDRLRRRSKGQPEPSASVSEPRRLQFDEIYSFFKDITSGLRFLHVNGYIHRDLKPSNCLLHETGREIRVLVSDFGEVQSENTVRNSTGNTGTISYCAPEVLRRLTADGPFGNFTFKSDVFSLGMILYFLCFAQLPYSNADIIDEDREDLDQLRAEISQWAGFDNVRRMRPDLPDKLYSFLTRLLSVDPDKRPTAEDVLNGIQAGVGANDGRRFHRNGPSSNDMHSASRVLPVDSPAAGTSPTRGSRSTNKKLPNTTSNLPSPIPVPVLQAGGYGTNTAKPSPKPESESTATNLGNDDNNIDHNLVVRASAPPSRGNLPSDDQTHRLYNPRHLLLPPPSRFSFITNFRSRRMIIPFLINFGLLVLKILSLTQPCTPLAVRPWILYPLVMLAALAFSIANTWVHLGALFLHVFIVVLTVRSDTLCVLGPAEFESV